MVAYHRCIYLGDSTGKKLRDWQTEGPTVVRFAPDGASVTCRGHC